MADQWFADQVTAEELDSSRRMMGLLQGDIARRLAALATRPGDATAMGKEIHSLRGAIASIGLAACAQHLYQLEKGWSQLPAAERESRLREANAAFQSGLEKLLGRFPHLR